MNEENLVDIMPVLIDRVLGKGTMSSIPYSKHMQGFKPVIGSPGVYCCALDKEEVVALSSEDTISMRKQLEEDITLFLGKPMQLGYAFFAQAPNTEEVVVACFSAIDIKKNTMEITQ
jgi:hypothetical protein